MEKKFYGSWITIAAFFTFGIAVGIPYYGGPFFYDYYEKTFGWSRKEITFGFPLAALLTLWAGPMLVHRFSPRKLILAGTGLTALAFLGFGNMGGVVTVYWALWVLYVTGYIFSGPIPHQVIVSQWYSKKRGSAMAIVYLGVAVLGGAVPKAFPWMVRSFGFQPTLMMVGLMMLAAWPLALLVLRDKPSDMGQFPDGAATAPSDNKLAPREFSYLVRQPAFWLLVVGSACSIGSIGSINQHM
jgi:hypothetical protein